MSAPKSPPGRRLLSWVRRVSDWPVQSAAEPDLERWIDRAYYNCPPTWPRQGDLFVRSGIGLDGQGQQARAVRLWLNYLIDTENAIIIDVEATPARTYDEVRATKVMLNRTRRHLGIKPKRLAGDTAYGTGRFLGWLVAPHIPVRDMSKREDGTFSRHEFRFDK
jgi:hypothetical protein